MSHLPETPLHLLEPRTGAAAVPSQFGAPWPRGAMPQPPQFDLVDACGSTPVDTWVTARWPDGSVKWTGHAGLAPAGDARLLAAEGADVVEGSAATAPRTGATIEVSEQPEGAISVDTGVLRVIVAPHDRAPLRRLEVDGRLVGQDGRIVASSAASPDQAAPRR